MNRVIFIFFATIILGCGNNRSVINLNGDKKMNGGFEDFCEDLPCNWYFYAPAELETETYTVSPDQNEFKEGMQSLKFDVSNVNFSEPIWAKPGMFQTYKARTGETYILQFWLKSLGAHLEIFAGSEHPDAMETKSITKINRDIAEWKLINFKYTVPEGFENIRFEINFSQPGTFWIDDFMIHSLTNQEEIEIW